MFRPQHPKFLAEENIQKYNMSSRDLYLQSAFSRNIGVFSEAEQRKLSQCRIAIPGMGGVGGNHLLTLTRVGIGGFHLADFDQFEPANLNRQAGARVSTFGKSKLEVMKDDALDINPYLDLKLFPEGLKENEIDEFLEGVDLVIDGLDFFCFEIRRKLFNRAREKGIYVITAGPLGFSTAMLIFSPQAMAFDDYFGVKDFKTPDEAALYFALGLAPRATHTKYIDFTKVDLSKKRGPSTDIACKLSAALAATEAVRILLGKGKVKAVPYYVQFDPFTQKYIRGKLRRGNRGVIQKFKINMVRSLLMKPKMGKSERQLHPPETAWREGELSETQLDFIIEAGIQAPSGDNVQPWRFKKGSNEILLYLDPQADHSFFNFAQIASVISSGAVLENMVLAGEAIGAQAEVTLLPFEKDQDCLARLSFHRQNPEVDPLFPYLTQRKTNRKMFLPKPIPPRDLQELKGFVEGDGFSRLDLFSGPQEIKEFAKMIYQADKIRTERRDLHEHLVEMIRFTPSETEERSDGFYLKNLEAGFMGEQFIKATRSWRWMNILNRIGLGRMVPFHSFMGIKKSAAIGVLRVPGLTRQDFIRGGIALQRMWLKITQMGLAMQPMTAITLFLLRWRIEGKHEFSPRHQDLIKKILPRYRQLVPKPDDWSQEAPVMLFRLGYAPDIQFPTLRKAVPSFLEDRS